MRLQPPHRGRVVPLRGEQLTHADVDAGRGPMQLGEKRRQKHGRNAIGSYARGRFHSAYY